MKTKLRVILATSLLMVIGVASLKSQSQPAKEQTAKAKVNVVIETEMGAIEVELEPERAPVTVANFLRYVDGGHYADAVFHRSVKVKPDNQPNNTVKIEVIQAGRKENVGVDAAQRKDPFPPILLERTSKTGLLHKDGVISMARSGPDTAGSDFFICVGDQPELDFGGKRNPDGQGFAAFGRVVRGMDVVRKIHALPVEAQRITPPVRIIAIRRK